MNFENEKKVISSHIAFDNNQTIHNCELLIVSPDFEEPLWGMFFLKGINVLIEDKSFMQLIEKGKISIGAGDKLVGILEIQLKLLSGSLNVHEEKYKLIKVNSYKMNLGPQFVIL